MGRSTSRSRAFALPFALAALAAPLVLPAAPAAETAGPLPPGYLGKPYRDSVQEIPGRVRMFRFDEGAEGVSWHDFENSNVWGCKLRAPAAVGLQLMGAGGDKWEPGKAEPGMTLVRDDCYLAQTNQGDWTKYTVWVKAKGTYSLSFLEAASSTPVPHVAVSFLRGTDSVSTGRIDLPLTSYFHNWVYARDLATLALDTGLQVLRFDIVGNGPMNINYIDFAPTGGVPVRSPSAPGAGAPAVVAAAALAGSGLRVSLDLPGSGPTRLEGFAPTGRSLFSLTVAADAGGRRVVEVPALKARGLVHLRVSQDGRVGLARAFLP